MAPWLDKSLVSVCFSNNDPILGPPGQRCGRDCDEAHMRFVEIWMVVETVKIVLRLVTRLIFMPSRACGRRHYVELSVQSQRRHSHRTLSSYIINADICKNCFFKIMLYNAYLDAMIMYRKISNCSLISNRSRSQTFKKLQFFYKKFPTLKTSN